jgi:NAD(P)H-hydrate epimerase
MKIIEGTSTSKYKIPSILLMENAGARVAEVVIKYLEELGKEVSESKVVVLSGVGNNGGDGAVAARHIHNLGAQAELVLTRDLNKIFSDGTVNIEDSPAGGLGEDTTVNLKILKHMNLPVHVVTQHDLFHRFFVGCDLIVDALLGTGLNNDRGKIKSPTFDLIMAVNELDIPVVAVDVPSGLDCNTGDLVGIGIQASKTVTFALPKKGFFKSVGPAYCGEIIVADIGIPRQLIENLVED